nr:UDP-4-amino-4,6-dideoxy-N-acetyl-beta-L-altrosamine transaminase [uncultured Shinella sp.]
MVIPYGRQDITEADIDAVRAVLTSDYLTQGPAVGRFERALADVTEAKYCIASNSATSSLHNACNALGVGPGDVVWTSPITFVASANCARYCGADVDFVDIDARSYTMSPERLEAKLRSAEKEGRLPKVVIPVHLAGQPADMPAIRALSERYGFKVVEDASHAIGGRIGDRPVGACQYSDITVFSFHPVKIVTTGEGGAATTNDPVLARRMALFNSHGITRDATEMSKEPDGAWYYEQVALGYNYRMTDIQAALGLSQMERLTEYVAKRHVIARIYDEQLRGLPLVTPWRSEGDYSGFHLYVIRLQLDKAKLSRRALFDLLRSRNILVNLHYIPVYRQPDFQQFGARPEDFPEAEAYYAEAISLPLYPTMTDEQQSFVISTIREALA